MLMIVNKADAQINCSKVIMFPQFSDGDNKGYFRLECRFTKKLNLFPIIWVNTFNLRHRPSRRPVIY